MKEHARTATKLIGEEIARLTQMARQIKADEQDKPCDENISGAIVPDKPLTFYSQEIQAEFWRGTSKVWYDRWMKIRKERQELWMLWFNRYNELKRFKLANFSRAELESELARRATHESQEGGQG